MNITAIVLAGLVSAGLPVSAAETHGTTDTTIEILELCSRNPEELIARLRPVSEEDIEEAIEAVMLTCGSALMATGTSGIRVEFASY